MKRKSPESEGESSPPWKPGEFYHKAGRLCEIGSYLFGGGALLVIASVWKKEIFPPPLHMGEPAQVFCSATGAILGAILGCMPRPRWNFVPLFISVLAVVANVALFFYVTSGVRSK